MSNIKLERVGWQDGILISKAKVEIDGVIYEVEPEQYSGQTPLSSANLKKMEDNTEKAINEESGTSIYKNSTGTTESITLSDSVTQDKYKYVEIKYTGGYGEPYSTGKLSTENLDRIHLNAIFLGIHSGPGALIIDNARISISGNVVSFVSNRHYEKPYNSGASGGVYTETANIKITEIIVYK